MIRAFLAVLLRESLRAKLAAIQSELKQRLAQDPARSVSISWVKPASMHLTMKFIGDIDEQLVAPLHAHMTNVLTGHRAIHIPLARLGAFPRPQQPRVLWIGPSEQWEQSEDAARLASLHRAIDGCCVSLNLASDTRPLTAHLTVARIKSGERPVGRVLVASGVMYRPLGLDPLSVRAIALMKSDLKPTGSVYTKVWELRIEE
jgi:RNA 2',3'-cyclic 3'-phosphodiesterase